MLVGMLLYIHGTFICFFFWEGPNGHGFEFPNRFFYVLLVGFFYFIHLLAVILQCGDVYVKGLGLPGLKYMASGTS